jgi:steroid 5-alpha reductase family enzyme
MLGVALTCFVVSELTNNCSQVDKLWSITPILYTWLFAFESDWSPRLVLMAVLATIWGVRLTYNFGRRGAYKLKFWEGHEDYRWDVCVKSLFSKTVLHGPFLILGLFHCTKTH